MSRRTFAVRSIAFAILLLFAADRAHAQTAAEMAALPEASQRATIDSMVANSLNNLTSKTDRSGNAKSDQVCEDDRAMANLVRAWFMQDPDHPNDQPHGPKAILYGIKKTAANEPSKTIVQIMATFVDGYYAKLYTDFYKPENKLIFQQKSDHDQAALFRVHIELEENRHANDRVIKAFDAKDAQIKKKMSDMYDNAIVLTDGRHVLRDKNGDFMVIQRNPDDGADVKLDFPYTIEAQSLYECMNARGISNGMQGRASCGSPPISATAAVPVPQAAPLPAPQPAPVETPVDDPIGQGGFIKPPTTAAPVAPQLSATAPASPRSYAPRSTAPRAIAPASSFKVLMCVERDLVDQHAWEHPAPGSRMAAFRKMAIPYIQSVGRQGWEYWILDVHYNRFDPRQPASGATMVVQLSPSSGRFDPANQSCPAKYAAYWVNSIH